jgi:hypothetical protein
VASQAVDPIRNRCEWLPSPVWAPFTVIAAEPVPGVFDTRTELRVLLSLDIAWVKLAIFAPTVMEILQVPLKTCPDLHVTDVAEDHMNPWDADCPKRAILVKYNPPDANPSEVNCVQPADGEFIPTELAITPSYDAIVECVWQLDAIERTARKLPETPVVKNAIRLVLDTQPVTGAAELPTRCDAVKLALHINLLVTLIAIELTLMLDDWKLYLADESNDNDSVALPLKCPVERHTRRVDLWPRDNRHCADVSESHWELLKADNPTAPRAENPYTPIPDPCNVTTTEPVIAIFDFRDWLTNGSSTENPPLNEPTRTPIESTEMLQPDLPFACLDIIDVSDCQFVCSSAVPSLPRSENNAKPKLPPWTVNSADPEEAKFDQKQVDKDGRLKVTAVDICFTFNTAVTDADWVPSRLLDILHKTAVSEIHVAASQALLPALALWLEEKRPKFEPNISKGVPPPACPFNPPRRPASSNEIISVSDPRRWPRVMVIR